MICVYCICWVTLKNNMSENKEKQKNIISSMGEVIWLVSTWPIPSTSLGWKLGWYSVIHAWYLGQVVLVGQTIMSSNLHTHKHTALDSIRKLCPLFQSAMSCYHCTVYIRGLWSLVYGIVLDGYWSCKKVHLPLTGLVLIPAGCLGTFLTRKSLLGVTGLVASDPNRQQIVLGYKVPNLLVKIFKKSFHPYLVT